MPDITCIFNLLDDYKVHPHGNDIVFTHTREENTTVVTGKEYLDTVDRLALALLNLEIKKGDTIATVLTNRPEWNYFDMAMLSIGAIQVPVYPTSGYDNCSFIFENAKISMLVIENEELLKKM
jgi:long-chain acyl-CoA synthetase